MTMSAAGSAPSDLVAITHVNSAFTEAELDSIARYADGLILNNALVRSQALPADAPVDDEYNRIRITKLADLHSNAATGWIYERMGQVIAYLNQSYRFDLNGQVQPFQYLVYRDTEGGHFDWHADPVPSVNRQMSLTLQLSSPSEYEGCELQFDTQGQIVTAQKTRGVIVAFPSHVLHRVTPITRGTRKSLVVWALGN